MQARKLDCGNGVEIDADFSDDEIERRADELLRRMLGKPGTFDMDTGQPLSGPQLSREELRRRGYAYPLPA